MQGTGLSPLGDLDAFITDKKWSKDIAYFDGADVHCCILDVRMSDDGEGGNDFGMLYQTRTPHFTSWNRGPFLTQVSVFCNVLEADGEMSCNLFGGRGAGVVVDSKAVGKGWRHYHSSRNGFGGEERSWFCGKGRMKIAIALPYVGTGYHGGVPVWSGFISDYYAQDTRALLTTTRR